MKSVARALWRAWRLSLAVVGLCLAVSGQARADLAFGAATSLSLGGLPSEMATGDFNEDGRPDLVVVDRLGSTVKILLNTGGGSGFSEAGGFRVGSAPYGVAAADFNGDGHLDVAVTSFNNGTATISLGDGSGGLSAPVTFGAGLNPRDLTVADFDGDGRLDLAIAVFSGAQKGVSVLWGDGDGRFDGRPRTDIGLGVAGRHVVSGDWNEDGHVDIVAGSGDGVFLLLGNGAGDGRADVVLSRFSGTVVVVPGLAGGGFSAQGLEYPVGESASPPAVADFSGDGHPDIVVLDDQRGYLANLRGDGAGRFAAARAYGIPERYTQAIAVADFDEDGRADVAVTHRDDDAVWIMRGDGAGGFEFSTRLDAGAGAGSVAAGDLNGDGHADLAVVNEVDKTIMVFLGNGRGTFTVAGQRSFIGLAQRSVVIGNFRGAGYPAYAVAWAPETGGVYEGVQGVGVSPQSSIEMLDVTSWDDVKGFAPLDVDQDGRADIVAATSVGTVGTSLSSASYPGDPVYVPAGVGALSAIAGWSQTGRAGVFASAGVQIASLAAAPGQALSMVGTYGAGISASVLAASDFDGDGGPDLVAADAASGELAIVRGQGAPGGLGAPLLRFVGGTPEQMVVADFNRDGLLDIAISNGLGGITVLVNASPSPNAALASLALSQGALSPAFAGGVTAYTATVPHGVAQLSLTPVAAQAGASITVNGVVVTSGMATAPLPLAVGANVIQVDVVAENGV